MVGEWGGDKIVGGAEVWRLGVWEWRQKVRGGRLTKGFDPDLVYY